MALTLLPCSKIGDMACANLTRIGERFTLSGRRLWRSDHHLETARFFPICRR